jgi:hypothetical protein
MTMAQLRDQLDNVLRLNGYPVFDGYQDYIKDDAMRHAETEYEHYLEIKKLEVLGVTVDLVDYYSGEYEEYREQTSQMSIKDLKRRMTAALEAPDQ